MSYSRWSFSKWYTYGHVDGGFMIQDVKHFSDAELRDVPNCLREVQTLTSCTTEELAELRGYIEMYKSDDFDPRMQTHSFDEPEPAKETPE